MGEGKKGERKKFEKEKLKPFFYTKVSCKVAKARATTKC